MKGRGRQMVRRRDTDRRTRCWSGPTLEVLGGPLVAALHAAADGGFVSDVEGRIVLWNAAAESILGYTATDIHGRPCCTLLRGDDSDAACPSPCAIGREAGAETPTFDVRAQTKAGLPVWISVSVLRLSDPRTHAAFVLHLFRDVTFVKEQLALAYEGRATVSPNGAATALTRREHEVLRLMGDGLNTVAMAKRLHLSRATVRNHVQNILLKLDVHSRLEAVAYGRRHRLL